MKIIGGKERLDELINEFWDLSVEKQNITAKLSTIGIDVKFMEYEPLTAIEFENELSELIEDLPEDDN